MRSLWSFLTSPKNQRILSWLGSGLVVAAGGLWAVATYIWPGGSARESAQIVCAQPGSVAAGRDAKGNTLNYNGAPVEVAGGREAPCITTKQH
jgi:hypothetical protein